MREAFLRCSEFESARPVRRVNPMMANTRLTVTNKPCPESSANRTAREADLERGA